MRPIVILAAALALTACAPTDTARPQLATDGSAAPRACFLPQQLVNFRQGSSQTLYVRTLRDEVFELNAAGCLDGGASYGLTIAPSFGIGDRLCVGDGARVTASNPSFARGPCQARVVRSLTPAEVEALPARDRP